MTTLTRQRILVIDPDLSLRTLMVTLLRREGYEADGAASPDEALRLGRTHHHDAILLEPRMSGGDVLLREFRGVPNLIIVTTPDLYERAGANVPGARAVLLKPFRLDELVNAVAGCCQSVQ